MNIEITSAGKTAKKASEIPASVVIMTRADIEAMACNFNRNLYIY